MDDTSTLTPPLFFCGALAFPAMAVCKHGDRQPVVVFIIVVGGLRMTVILKVDM